MSALESPSGWWRDRAQQALVERHAGEEAVVAELRTLLVPVLYPPDEQGHRTNWDSPGLPQPDGSVPHLTRLHALWTLDGLGALSVDDVRLALWDVDPRMRRAGAQLSERWLGTHPGLVERLAELDDDESVDVRIQALLSLGASPSTACAEALAQGITTDAALPERRSAVLSALSGREAAFLERLLANPRWSGLLPGRDTFLELLARNIGRTRASDSIGAVLDGALRSEAPDWQRKALLEGLLAARPTDPLGQPGRLPLATQPLAWSALHGCADAAAAELAAALWFPGHPTPDDRPVIRALDPAEQAAFDQGQTLYEVACASCHQPSGQGQVGTAPPLVSSPWVLGDPERLARILLQGLSGPVTVRGATWDLDMPALAGSDEQLAAVLTYIRREWGHGAEPLTPEQVATVRAATGDRDRPWTIAELESLEEH
jgi:mono/diheme cytochrome c family protein